MLIASEEEEQIAFAQWLNAKKILFYHIPNEGKRHINYARKLKKMGVSKGVPDLCIPVPCSHFHGLYIELKRKQGGLISPAQLSWIAKLNDKGYKAVIANGCEEAVKVTEEYFMDSSENKSKILYNK